MIRDRYLMIKNSRTFQYLAEVLIDIRFENKTRFINIYPKA